MSDRDATIEEAAQKIEDIWIFDLRSTSARRKRDREDAALWNAAVKETRRTCAKEIRSLKMARNTDAIEVLRHIASLPPGREHTSWLREAWPLAWKGLVDVRCVLRCNSNCIPPETEYRIELTEKGKAALADASAPPRPIEDAPMHEHEERA